MLSPEIAVIIPACNEAVCLGPVLDELLRTLDPEKFVIAVGVNDSSDETAEVARRRPVLVAETEERGYGYGCAAAIRLTNDFFPAIQAYLFCAGDGANAPADLLRVTAAYAQGYDFVLGARTTRLHNWRSMTLRHMVANALLGLWCGLLSGRPFRDLGPLRILSRSLFERIAPREMTYGWTIEAQVAAAKLGATIREIPVTERRRLGGQQKVSGVSWTRTLSIGCKIVAAGWRTGRDFRSTVRPPHPVLLPAPRSQPEM